MPSKIIQFQIVTTPQGSKTLYVLDEDGNMWSKNLNSNMSGAWISVVKEEVTPAN